MHWFFGDGEQEWDATVVIFSLQMKIGRISCSTNSYIKLYVGIIQIEQQFSLFVVI